MAPKRTAKATEAPNRTKKPKVTKPKAETEIVEIAGPLGKFPRSKHGDVYIALHPTDRRLHMFLRSDDLRQLQRFANLVSGNCKEADGALVGKTFQSKYGQKQSPKYIVLEMDGKDWDLMRKVGI